MDHLFSVKKIIRSLVFLALNLVAWRTLGWCSDATFYDLLNVMNQGPQRSRGEERSVSRRSSLRCRLAPIHQTNVNLFFVSLALSKQEPRASSMSVHILRRVVYYNGPGPPGHCTLSVILCLTAKCAVLLTKLNSH